MQIKSRFLKKKAIRFGTLIMFSMQVFSLNAQRMTYFSIESGPSWDISRIDDAGGYFIHSNTYGTIFGATVNQDIIPNLSLETGAYWHNYANSVNILDQRSDKMALHSFSSLLLPGRIAYRFTYPELPFSLTLSLGYQFGLLFEQPLLNNNSSSIVAPDSTFLHYQLNEDLTLQSNLHLIEAGISADYRFDNNWMVSLAYHHYSGLSEVKSTEVLYKKNNETTANSGYYSNDGSRYQLSLSLKAPVSNLWQKQDERRHARIENSRLAGSDLHLKHYIYFGADLGTIWRSFSNSNPAISARPMNGKGVFRYSNLHMGAYAGYQINDYSGIDLGLYYQRSSSFYAVMYDHEVDFVTKIKAPLFLEVPLMYRYYVDIYKKRVLLSLKGGVSMLTHFNMQTRTIPGGSIDISGNAAILNPGNAERLTSFGFMLKAGTGVEYRLPIKLPVQASLDITYNMGLNDIDQITVSSNLTEVPANSTITYSGSGWVATIGVKMPFLLGKENRACKALPLTRSARL